MTQVKYRRYVPNITQQMAMAEANYQRLQRLLGDLEQTHAVDVTLCAHSDEHQDQLTQLAFTIVERFRYTMTLAVQLGDPKQWWNQPLYVRIYHDVRMAEVVKSDNFRQYYGRYSYPNKLGLMANEKAQLNAYLAQLLRQALQHGIKRQHRPLVTGAVV